VQYFTSHWHNTFTTHVSDLTTFNFLLLSIHNKCPKYSVPGSVRPWTCLVMNCRSPLFNGPGSVANVLTDTQKGAGEVSLHFKLELNSLGGFQVFQQITI